MKPALLDTTALLAHYFNEHGAADVQDILDGEAREILVCAVSLSELARPQRWAPAGGCTNVVTQRVLTESYQADSGKAPHSTMVTTGARRTGGSAAHPSPRHASRGAGW